MRILRVDSSWWDVRVIVTLGLSAIFIAIAALGAYKLASIEGTLIIFLLMAAPCFFMGALAGTFIRENDNAKELERGNL